MDLHDALHDLHRDWRGAVADRAAGPVVAAARRRRAVRRTGYGAVGAGAVAARVVGGLSLPAWRPTPPPPAVTSTSAPAPTPTPAPTRTTEPSATPSWTPTPAAPFQPDLSLCGTTVDVGADDLQVFTTDAYLADRGAPLTAPYEVDVDGTGGERVTVAPTVSVLVDASPDASSDPPVVIGVAARALPGPAARVLDGWSEGGGPSASLQLPLALPFVMCPGVDGAGGPPPDGEYGVWTRVELTKDGTTHSGWGPAFITVGPLTEEPEPAPTLTGPLREYPPDGTVRIDSRLDQSWCGKQAQLAGLSPDMWSASDGPYTAQATARIDAGDLVVAMQLSNNGQGITGVDIRYPSFYVVNDAAIPDPYDRPGNQYPFPASSIMHVGNVGVVSDIRAGTLGGPTPSWLRKVVFLNGAPRVLETSAGSDTCTEAFGTPWPKGSYTIYAFSEVSPADGTTTRVQAAPITLVVP